MAKKQPQADDCLELCSQCAIDDAFTDIEAQPLSAQMDLVMDLWVNRYSEELRTVAALFAWTTHTSQRWADEQTPVKKKPARLKLAA